MKTTSKDTPGPWKVTDSGYRVVRVSYSPSDSETVTDCRYICDTANNKATRIPENAANARLIAAAPELLDALKEINQHLRDVVETSRNGDRNNWEGYYVPEFGKLATKFTDLIRKAEEGA